MTKSAIVIGAGIVGLATARALALRGYQVSVFDRNERAVGASIRNFGMIWPIGQPEGVLYERALRSRSIWTEVLQRSGCWYSQQGSLHMAYHADEWTVLQEFKEASQPTRPLALLSPGQTRERSSIVQPAGLLGSLYSADEMIVDPRQAIGSIPSYLAEQYGVTFHWNTAISQIEYPKVWSGKRQWSADEIYVCSGVDFETLYPEAFAEAPITKCKVQMLRLEAQNVDIGPSLCGGLSLIHYKGFLSAPSLPRLLERYQREKSEYMEWGIHVMASQNGLGEITVGDSHEYGLTFDPFDRTAVNALVLDYLRTFTTFPSYQIQQTWHGIYPKHTQGKTEWVTSPESGVTVINGLGGAGMTLSFGLCEAVVAGTYQPLEVVHS